jgi:hypothetical protein
MMLPEHEIAAGPQVDKKNTTHHLAIGLGGTWAFVCTLDDPGQLGRRGERLLQG